MLSLCSSHSYGINDFLAKQKKLSAVRPQLHKMYTDNILTLNTDNEKQLMLDCTNTSNVWYIEMIMNMAGENGARWKERQHKNHLPQIDCNENDNHNENVEFVWFISYQIIIIIIC